MQLFQIDETVKKNIPKGAIGGFVGFSVAAMVGEFGTSALKLTGNVKVIVSVIIKIILGIVLLALSRGKLGIFGVVAGYASFAAIGFDVLQVLGVSSPAEGMTSSISKKLKSASKAASAASAATGGISGRLIEPAKNQSGVSDIDSEIDSIRSQTR